MRVTIPLNGPTRQDRAIQCNSQRSINMYAEFKEGDAKAELVQYSQPGLKKTTTIGVGPFRNNAPKFDGKIWWVSGAELFSQSVDGTFTKVGTLLTTGSRVVMAPGRNVMMLVDGTYGYYTDGSTLTRITDSDFPDTPTHCTYIDGYFPTNDADTDDWFINTTTEAVINWAALDFETDAAKPDKTLAILAHAKDVYNLGEDSVQTYFNSGNADFPFETYPSSVPMGIDAPHSVVSSTHGLIWLGGTTDQGGKAIVKMQGQSAVQISDKELTWQINKLSTTSDAVAWVRRQGGNTFYEIMFPAAGRSWSINLDADNMPAELKSFGIDRFMGQGYGYIGGKSYVGHYQNGDLFELDYDTLTDNTNSFIRKRVTRVIHNKGLSLSFRSLILDAEAGVGLITGQGSDPQVIFRYRVDGEWSSELWKSLGAIGERDKKPTWGNLGTGHAWEFEFKVSDPVRFNLFNLFADVDVGRN